MTRKSLLSTLRSLWIVNFYDTKNFLAKNQKVKDFHLETITSTYYQKLVLYYLVILLWLYPRMIYKLHGYHVMVCNHNILYSYI